MPCVLSLQTSMTASRPVEPGGVLEGVQHLALREGGKALGKIAVQARARSLDGRHAGGGVYVADVGGGIEAAGAVADAYLRPALYEQAAEGGDKLGMGGNGAVRLAPGDEVGLDGDLHARAHPIQAAEGRKRLHERRFHAVVGRAARNGHIRHVFSPIRSSFPACVRGT